jgi:sigma-B regulation protein RsbU (phosphoserine phosphatase)
VTNSSRRPDAPLELAQLEAPEMRPLRVNVGDRIVIGRGADSGLWINNASVSRQHAAFSLRSDGAYIEDLGSRHGTRVNGVPVRAGKPVKIAAGDVMHFGPSAVRVGYAMERIATSTVAGDAEAVRTIVFGNRGGAEQAMRVLMDVVRRIPRDGDEEAAGAMLLERLVSVTHLERALLVRASANGSDAEIIASAGARAGAVSRTVLAAASDPSRVAHLSQISDIRAAESIAGSGVREIVCARLALDEDERIYLYLDSRRELSSVDGAMAEFIGAAARICALVFESFRRRRLEELEQDVARARVVQQRLLPGDHGETGPVRWRLLSQPGALLAGDFAGVAERPDGSILAWVGDVVGKGPAAAMLMASAQAWLYASANRVQDVAEIVASLNEFLCHRSETTEFATLFVAAIAADGTVSACDAGHGLAFHIRGGVAHRLEIQSGLAAGVMSGEQYAASTVHLGHGERLVLVTDGVHEQPSVANERFGLDRVVETLGASASHAHDVDTIVTSLSSFSQQRFEDDVTILSIERR